MSGLKQTSNKYMNVSCGFCCYSCFLFVAAFCLLLVVVVFI